jgi:hypothetical protein
MDSKHREAWIRDNVSGKYIGFNEEAKEDLEEKEQLLHYFLNYEFPFNCKDDTERIYYLIKLIQFINSCPEMFPLTDKLFNMFLTVFKEIKKPTWIQMSEDVLVYTLDFWVDLGLIEENIRAITLVPLGIDSCLLVKKGVQYIPFDLHERRCYITKYVITI